MLLELTCAEIEICPWPETSWHVPDRQRFGVGHESSRRSPPEAPSSLSATGIRFVSWQPVEAGSGHPFAHYERLMLGIVKLFWLVVHALLQRLDLSLELGDVVLALLFVPGEVVEIVLDTIGPGGLINQIANRVSAFSAFRAVSGVGSRSAPAC